MSLPSLVVLDGYTLNPGDLSWAPLEALAACTIHDRTPTEEIVTRGAKAELLLTNKTPLSAATLAQLPALRYIGVLATGYNIIDVAAARARGVTVCNVPTYGTRSVAQHVFALLLELTQHVGLHAATVREGRWARSADFSYWDTPLIELEGLTLGLIGAGRIGQTVADLGRAFGMRVQFATRAGGAAELAHVLRTSDVVSLHCPLTDATRNLINADSLRLLKPGAFLINTSRGPLIDEPALAAALNAGQLAGAALDVLATEPPPAAHPLYTARNCLITPHLAWATTAARTRLMHVATENVRAFLTGAPVNVVN
ncbi:D-2-hydroxyacid dehydrogenase [Horticoccus luteus]|uniref:D-2-hydroxyacid dehydrogenase n=1 Tax=Horticoccus luteus TaxID=2862869 RepID=A0A8F9XKE0_9BACT|nr:D-2-hydroxyacid dehydrogenase [Horticoccus luteus]QYM79598.1 D-2-hydroxyacid dehydrogenase [Horticoccus luteus]